MKLNFSFYKGKEASIEIMMYSHKDRKAKDQHQYHSEASRNSEK